MATIGEKDLNSIEANHKAHLLTNLAQMRRGQSLCDIKLVCSGTIFHAHCCILSAASPYFKSQLQTLMLENDSNELIVPIDSHTMVIFLDFIYTGRFELNANILPSAITAAHLLQFPDVYDYCVAQVESNINVENYVKIWKAAEKCGNYELQETVVNYCCENIENLLAEKSIGKCSLTHIRSIALSQKLSPEITMRVVMVWLQQDPTTRKIHLQNLWRDIALPIASVTPLIEKGVFNSAPDFLATIKIFLSQTEQANKVVTPAPAEEPEQVPPLPPRRKPAIESSRPAKPPASSPAPILLTPQIMQSILQPPSSLFVFQPEDEEINNSRLSFQHDSAPEPPPRSLSLPPEQEKETFLLIFAVTRNKRLAVQRYNIDQKQWTPSQDFPLPKQYAIPPVITAIDNNIYILGGSTMKVDFDSSVYVTSIDEYTRRELSNMLLPRVHCGVASLNGLLYVVGGRNKTGWLRDVERYNPDLDVWHQMAPLSEPKSALGVTVVQGRIYAVGGLKGSRLFSLNTECYDPLADQWTVVEPINTGRYRMGISSLDKKFYVIGGALELAQNPENFLIYDTIKNTWESSSSPEMFIDDQPCMLTWNNKLWIISRRNYCLFCFDPADFSWNQLETSPAARHWQFIKNIVLMSI